MEGQIVSHYRVLARLGGGGMGVVYRAEDTRLKRTVALKFLPPELTADPEARERFLQEAQAASALDHPNICTIHDADADAEGRLFIAMAYYEGETLKERLSTGPLPVAEALDHALQIARGLDKAHAAGIVHRDIKPANVMVTRDRLVKIVDFGIAKLLDRTGPTRTGTTLGTVAYMAPEQIEGKHVDRRVDLWALGVVLYEMLTGQRPFGGDREMAIIRNILDAAPMPARAVRPDIPTDVERLLIRALAKDPAGRFQTAGEFIDALTACLPSSTGAMTDDLSAVTSAKAEAAPAPRAGRRLIAVAAAVALLAAAGTAAWFMNRASQAQRAQTRLEALVAQISTQADADDFTPALVALEEAERLAPADARLPELALRISDTRDIVTMPDGARVSVKPYDDVAQPWRLLGQTPMAGVRLARELFRWKIELAGHETLEVFGPPGRPFPPLAKTGQYPADTLPIGRGPAGLLLAGYGYARPLPSGSFLIDKFEVTNRQYKAFVDAGGYTRREYWQKEILRDGRPVPWEQAMSEFRDRTGRQGPATWEVGNYPAGQQDHPVTGVSWYEADAFATFSKRSLPTVYHWLRASGVQAAAFISPLSNLNGKGPAPVGSFAGLSPFGTLDMAGNAKEWTANAVQGTNERYILGGSWRDAVHMFYFADARSPLDRSDDNGFRLATFLEPVAAMLNDPVPIPRRNFDALAPVSDEMFSTFLRQYAYDPRPLDARVEARDESAPTWIREKVSLRAAYGNDRLVAYMFLPRHVKPPFQTIVYAPAASAVTSRGFDAASGADFNAVDYLIQSGRAVAYPVYSGTYERNTGQSSVTPDRTRAYQDWMVQIVNDARRTVDYLESRADIRSDRLAFVATSWGASLAPRILAVEKRFKTAVLADTGYSQATEILPELDTVNYLPRVTLPLLMINGDSDFLYPVDTAQRPFFDHVGTPREQKRKVTLQGGHFVIQPQRNQVVREVLSWLDQYLGALE